MSASTVTPVSLLTGFLGSGKTTLLNALLRDPALSDTAVLINELGAIPIDHHLVREANDDIAVLANGCVCCSVAGDLVRAMRELYFKRASGEVPHFSRVIIETTGLADPAPILHTLIEMPLVAARYTLAGVITTVDAEHAMRTLDDHFEAIKQVAVADRIVITKSDRVEAHHLQQVRDRVRALNPAATLFVAANGAIDATSLFDSGAYRLHTDSDAVRDWLRAERYRPIATSDARGFELPSGTRSQPTRHDERIRAFTLRFTAPLDWQRFVDALDVLVSVRGDNLLRFKAIVDMGEAAPRAVHAVQHSIYPHVVLPSWPTTPNGSSRTSELVFITRDVDPAFIRDVFAQYLEQAPAAARAADEANAMPA